MNPARLVPWLLCGAGFYFASVFLFASIYNATFDMEAYGTRIPPNIFYLLRQGTIILGRPVSDFLSTIGARVALDSVAGLGWTASVACFFFAWLGSGMKQAAKRSVLYVGAPMMLCLTSLLFFFAPQMMSIHFTDMLTERLYGHYLATNWTVFWASQTLTAIGIVRLIASRIHSLRVAV